MQLINNDAANKMANPIETLRKLKGRSLREIRVRGEQALAARTEQIGLSGKLPTDAEFAGLIDKSAFAGENFSAESLRAKFYEIGENSFFQSFARREKTLEIFRAEFGGIVTASIIDRAERVVEGRFDLLGYRNLDFGEPVDWHFEPVAKKRSPLKHWKQFDELATDETGDKKIVWELNRHQHFFTLGQAYWLTGDEQYAETFAQHLTDWMEKNPPGFGVNWASSLEVAFRAVSWIWAFHFFRDSASLTPALFYDAARYSFLHGRHIEKYLSTYYSPNTHLTGEALGLYYLGTQLPFFERAAHWRKTGADILLAELDRQILPDGVYFEQSNWYQRYTADFYTHFSILENLNDKEKIDENSREKLGENLGRQFDFLMHATRPDGTTPLVGDDDGGRSLPLGESEPDDFRGVLSTGAALLERGDYKFVAKNFAEETLWLLGADGARSFENTDEFPPEQTSRAFSDGGYFIMRDGWTETDNYLLVDCGNTGALAGGHAHADALSIDLSVGGKRTLVDAGTYTYHESESARNCFRATEAHNTLTIDGASQSEPCGKFSWQTRASARLNHWISQDRFDFFEGAHDGYERLEKAPAVHTRGILFLKNDYAIVRDFVETRGAHDYALNFQFDRKTNPTVEISEDGNSFAEEKHDSAVGLRLFAFGDNGDWTSRESEISPIYGEKIAAPQMKFASAGVGSQEFFSFLLPVENGFVAPEVFETQVSGARAFVVSYRDYKDIFVFSDGAGGETVRTEIFNTNFRFSWARLSAGDKAPDEFVLVGGGTHFSVGGRDVLNQTQPLDFATARRFGNRLNVRTPDNIFSVSLPQKKKATTYVLKNSA